MAKPLPLTVVGYHYVRPIQASAFPALKGMEVDAFVRQVEWLAKSHEIVSLDNALAYLRGEHESAAPLCLLTFDDGFRDHFEHVFPALRSLGLSGAFFLITSTQEQGKVADVHKSHFLMARLGQAEYERRFCARLAQLGPDVATHVDPTLAARSYRFDDAATARFKYLINFVLAPDVKGTVLDGLFAEEFGDEHTFACGLYLQWDEVREMAAGGMSIGGHTHRHQALATLDDAAQGADLGRCADLLQQHLGARPRPFCYPYGKTHSFTAGTVAHLQRLGFNCAFTTEQGRSEPGADLYRIRRIDANDVKVS